MLPQILLWTPRILGILFALFVSLFAFDVFGMGYSFWNAALALFVHLVPIFLLLIGLAIAWHWEWVGAVVFPGFSVWYLMTFGGAVPLVCLSLDGRPTTLDRHTLSAQLAV